MCSKQGGPPGGLKVSESATKSETLPGKDGGKAGGAVDLPSGDLVTQIHEKCLKLNHDHNC